MELHFPRALNAPNFVEAWGKTNLAPVEQLVQLARTRLSALEEIDEERAPFLTVFQYQVRWRAFFERCFNRSHGRRNFVPLAHYPRFLWSFNVFGDDAQKAQEYHCTALVLESLASTLCALIAAVRLRDTERFSRLLAYARNDLVRRWNRPEWFLPDGRRPHLLCPYFWVALEAAFVARLSLHTVESKSDNSTATVEHFQAYMRAAAAYTTAGRLLPSQTTLLLWRDHCRANALWTLALLVKEQDATQTGIIVSLARAALPLFEARGERLAELLAMEQENSTIGGDQRTWTSHQLRLSCRHHTTGTGTIQWHIDDGRDLLLIELLFSMPLTSQPPVSTQQEVVEDTETSVE